MYVIYTFILGEKSIKYKLKGGVNFKQKSHISFKCGRASHYKCNAQIIKLRQIKNDWHQPYSTSDNRNYHRHY